MNYKKLSPLSFKLKNGGYDIAFSPDGKLIAQIGYRRVYIWDIETKKIISDFKLIKNESYLEFSHDSKIISVKNTNGEIIFAEPLTGKVISTTGEFKLYREGCHPQFLATNELLDGDGNGILRLIDPKTSTEVASHRLNGNYMCTCIVSSKAKNKFIVALNAKSNQVGGSHILCINNKNNFNNPQIIYPTTQAQKREGGWKHIEKISISLDGTKLALALNGITKDDPNTIEIINLNEDISKTIYLPSRKHYVRSMSWSQDNILCACINENTYEIGQPMKEYLSKIKENVFDHLHFYSGESLQLLAKLPWKGAICVVFSPAKSALAVASDDTPSLYLGDFTINNLI